MLEFDFTKLTNNRTTPKHGHTHTVSPNFHKPQNFLPCFLWRLSDGLVLVDFAGGWLLSNEIVSKRNAASEGFGVQRFHSGLGSGFVFGGFCQIRNNHQSTVETWT